MLVFLRGTLVSSKSVVSPIKEVTARSEYDSSYTVAERAIDNDVDTIYFSKMDEQLKQLVINMAAESNKQKENTIRLIEAVQPVPQIGGNLGL